VKACLPLILIVQLQPQNSCWFARDMPVNHDLQLTGAQEDEFYKEIMIFYIAQYQHILSDHQKCPKDSQFLKILNDPSRTILSKYHLIR
jgi:hypothetical protein